MNYSDQVWKLYVEKFGGRVKARVLAQECYAARLREDELGKHIIDWYEAWVIKILKEHADPTSGLRAARPVGGDESAGVWTTRSLWNKEEQFEVVERLKKGLYDDYETLVAEHQDCLRAHGEAPEIPHLSEIPSGYEREEAA